MADKILKQLFFLCFIIPLSLCPLSADDNYESWNIGITEFSGKDLSIEESQHLTAIPLILLQEIEKISFHTLTVQEWRYWRKSLDRRDLRALERDLHEKIRERDELLLRAADQEKINSASESVQLIREKMKTLEEADYTEPPVSLELEIQLDEVNKKGELLQAPSGPLEVWRYRRRLDCVISGLVENLGELLYVEIVASPEHMKESQIIYRGTFFSNERESIIRESIGSVRTFLYGREWSDIKVSIEPQNAEYTIDGQKMIPDPSGRFRYLEPGSHELVVSARGYETKIINLETADTETVHIETVLKKKNPVDLLIQSSPAKSEVYVDSVLKGTTPLLLREQVLPATVLVRRKDYQDKFQAARDGSGEMKFSLHPEAFDLEKMVDGSRRRFYRGLAAFLFSVPLTVVAYGQSEQFGFAYNSAVSTSTGSYSEIERLKTKSTLWYTAYLGSLFLNSILFTDTIIGMTQYIRSTQEY